MKNKLIPHLMSSLRQPDLRNQDVIKYTVWDLAVGIGNWSDSGNWVNNLKPTGGSNVLFGPYQGTCIINENTPHLNCFRVRNDYSQTITCPSKTITLSGYFTFYGDGTFSTNSSTINATSGDVRLDGDGRVFWDRSIWNLTGSFIQKSLDTPVDNFSTINMGGSGKTIYSEDEIYRLNINGETVNSGNLTINGPLTVNNILTIPTGSNIINHGISAQVTIGTTGRTEGPGYFIFEDDASLVTQRGYIGNDYLLIRNNNLGEVLPCSTYSVKNLLIQNADTSYDAFIFGTGHYQFDSDVTFESVGSGTLEVNTKFKAPILNFNKGFTINSGNFSTVIWKTGEGNIILGKPTSIAKEFTRYICERGGVNISDNPKGLAVSYKNRINDEPIVWILDSGDINYAGSGIGIRAVTNAGHTVGIFLQISSTVATGLGDLAIARTTLSSNERLYVGDIADPEANRPMVRMYYATEPTVTGFDFYSSVVVSQIHMYYPASPVGESGGISRDARAVSFDYNTSDLYIVTHKTSSPQLFFLSGNVYFVPQTLNYSGTLQIESGVLGMDIARNGKEILVQTKENLYYYKVTGNNTICQTLTGTIPITINDYVPGYNEEGVAWGSGRYLNDTINTIETFNATLHNSDLRSPMWLYKKESVIDTNNILLNNIVAQASGHQKRLDSHLHTRDISILSGALDLNGFNLTSDNDFYVGPYGNFDRRGFKSGAIVNVLGDFLAVGSTGNIITMNPDTSAGGWVLHVSGEARAYYVGARASNASSGSTVYAYLSADFGSNTNWVWNSGFAPFSGVGIDLFISGGTGGTSLTGPLPLYIVGKTADASGYIDLYLGGAGTGYLYSRSGLNLSISGTYVGVSTGSIPLYIANSGVSGGLSLYISGAGISSGFVPTSSVLYLSLANSGIESGLPLIIVGGGSSTGGLYISIQGMDSISGGIPLYLSGVASATSGPNSLRLYSHGRHASN